MGNTQSTGIYFKIIDKAETNTYLVKAESIDNYIKQCSDNVLNFKARQRNNYSFQSLSHIEYNILDDYLKSVLHKLPQRLLYDLKMVNIIPLMPSADGGMPHTRPTNCICFSNLTHMTDTKTLIHELWHIHQRMYKDIWNNIFTKWGWKEWVDKLPDKLNEARRFNPDTIDTPLWSFNGWVPVPIFMNVTRPILNDVAMWFYSINNKNYVTQIPYEIETYFKGAPQSAYEHPREMSAYMLSDSENYKECIGFNKLITLVGITSLPYSR